MKSTKSRPEEVKSQISYPKHIEWAGLKGNESKIDYNGISTVKLEIIFVAKSPQETDLALCEITEMAGELFNSSNINEKYYFKAPVITLDGKLLGKALEDVQGFHKKV